MNADPSLDSAVREWIRTTSRLLTVPAVVGSERPLFLALERELRSLGVEAVRYDGYLVARGARPESATLSAHADRNGLECTGPGEFQYAAFASRISNEAARQSLSWQLIDRVAKRLPDQAVRAYDPWSGLELGCGIVRSSEFCPIRNNLVFEVEGLDHVPVGAPLAYADPMREEDGRVSAQLDNVLGVALVLELYRHGYAGTALFTAQEEAGRSWRFIAEHFRRAGRTTRELLVLDTSPFPDSAAAEAQDVVLRRKDAGGEFASETVDRLEAACGEAGIRHAYKDALIEEQNRARAEAGQPALGLGRTELGRVIEATQGEITGATVQVPTTGYHTSAETAHRDCLAGALRLLAEVLVLELAS